MNTSKRRGFTLVELLIVIVVIGVLAAMMILSSTESVTTAKATKIIANLNNIKRATIEWYLDNREKVKEFNKTKNKIQYANKNDALGISKYLSGGEHLELNKGGQDELQEGCYGVFDVWAQRTTWYVGYKFKKNEEAVKRKLKDRIKSAGLVFAQKWPNPEDIDQNKLAKSPNLEGYETVWIHVLGDSSYTEWWNKEEVEKSKEAKAKREAEEAEAGE